MRYYEAVEVLNYGYASASEIYLDGTYGKKSYQQEDSTEVRNNIEGTWESVDNKSHVMIVRQDNMLYEKKDGTITGSGSWIIRDKLSETKFADMPSGLYLQKNILTKGGEEATVFYEVLDLNSSIMKLSQLDNENIVTFTKQQGTGPSNRSL